MSFLAKVINSNTVSWTLTCVGSIYAVSCATANTFLIHQYQKVFEAYENENPKEVPEKMKHILQKVLDDLEVEEYDKKLAKLYMSIRPNLSHMGYLDSKYSFRIGLPLKFCYEKKEDLNRNMKIETYVVDWNSKEGKILEESLILSEKAKKFALAQEVYKCHLLPYVLSLFYPIFGLMVSFGTGEYGQNKLQLSRKPPQARLVFYSLACFLGYGMYVLLEDQTKIWQEKMSLDRLSSLGQEYIEGGIEYFDKELKTNMALRNLLHDGVKNITVTGNPNYFIRQRSLPLTYQKSYLEGKLKKLEENESQEVLE